MTNGHYKPNWISRCFEAAIRAYEGLRGKGWFRRHYLWVIIPAALVFYVLVWWFIASDIPWSVDRAVDKLADALAEDEPDTEAVRNYGYAIAALLGALALLASVPFQLIKTYVNERNTTAAEQGLITERFTKAVEQLGAEKTVKFRQRRITFDTLGEGHTKGHEILQREERANSIPPLPDGAQNIQFESWQTLEETKPNIEVRLGAIYALERIAQDSLRDHIPIMETLCAYVRQNANPDPPRDLPDEAKDRETIRAFFGEPRPLRADVQAVFEVIKRRSPAQTEWEDRQDPAFRLNLRRANLQGLHLSDVDLTKASLRSARLEGADLGSARLEGADLSLARLEGAKLINARLERAYLSGARLEGADLNFAWLKRADLSFAWLEGADLSFARLEGVDLSPARLEGAELTGAGLRSAILTFAENLDAEAVERGFGVREGVGLTRLPDGMEHPAHWHDADDPRWRGMDPRAAFEADYEAWRNAGFPTEADWRERADKA